MAQSFLLFLLLKYLFLNHNHLMAHKWLYLLISLSFQKLHLHYPSL
ncbi:hypothetical protein HERIO_2776 [Hepatospora eriocheir]|uniref:Uncharacterized protein n=1 Tax=Hepatospora eriocheir TaxID=1081669 RepID=A0A1X0Q8A3_9MICR|nr:hypothetical protein HERIO_2776 [Hepatospora eriocheir]